MNTTDPILEKLTEEVADILALEVEDVKPSNRFFEDLQGESIDFLDLSFRCKKQFGVEFPLQRMISDERLAVDEKGLLTPGAIAFLKQELPFLDFSRIEDNPLKNRLTEMWTVEAIAEYVRRAMAAGEPGRSENAETAPLPA